VFLLCITSQNIIHYNSFFVFGLWVFCYLFFFNLSLFFKFYPLTFDLLEIELHDLLQFAFYVIILILWLVFWVWRINLVDSSFFFLICFDLFYMRLSWSYDLGRKFLRLARVTRVDPICCRLNIVFFFNVFLNSCESNYIFTGNSSCFWTCKVDWVTSSYLSRIKFSYLLENH
jgi:hypothetical protein